MVGVRSTCRRTWLVRRHSKRGNCGQEPLLCFAFERHICRPVVYYLQELVNPGKGSPFRVRKAPDVKVSEFKI